MGELSYANDLSLVLPVRSAVFQTEIPAREERALQRFELPFNGCWVLDEDALKAGVQNYADLQNLRYTNTGLEGVQGYARLTTVALGRPALRSGIQFIKVINGVPTSTLLLQAYNAGLTTSGVYLHTATIPAVGEFTVAPVWTDGAGAGLGRFSLAPDGTVIYCNGVETLIWGSSEHRIAAVVNYDDPGLTFRYDVTDRMLETLSTAASLVTLARDGANAIWLLVGSTRPLQGIKFYVTTVNVGASTSTVEYWNGSAWTAVAGFTDGTLVAGVTLAQTGTMTFDSTVSTARVKFEDERLLYFYRVKVGATGTPDPTIQLAQMTVDAPLQAVVDIWDGVERTPIYGSVNNADYTLELLETSSSAAPIAAQLRNLTAGQEVLFGFEERMTALQLRLLAGKVNTAVATLTLAYWNGTAWTAVTATDGTIGGIVPLFQSGAISWNAPAATSEYRVTLFGRTAYYYRLTWSATLSNVDDIWLDSVTGIPAQRWNASMPVFGYTFPFTFAGRAMLAGLGTTNELNRVDYSAALRPDVWNGDQASDQGKAIYIGDHAALTSAIEMSNRFAGNATALCLAHKAAETWLLQGNSPENFTTFRISSDVGNPAPLSLALAEVPFAVDNQAIRTVALWCSAKGPVMSEGSVLIPMRFPQPDGAISSVDAYFKDTTIDSRGMNTSAWANVRGWYDAQNSEYNLLLPSGSGQTTCNVWLCCDMRRRKWFKKVPTVYPQMVVTVRDTRGVTYPYGGLDTGHLLRLEVGATWDGSAIAHQLDTADVPLTASIWDATRVRYVTLGFVRETGTAATITLAQASEGSGTFATVLSTDITTGTERYTRYTAPTNLLALTHQWRLTLSTTGQQRAPRLLGMSLLYGIEREDIT